MAAPADRRPSGPILSVAPFPSAPPPGFVHHAYDHRWEIGRARTDVWSWLCDPATFTDSQVWPYRVEFVHPVTGRPAGFEPGVLTTHHGPGMHFCGVLGAIEDGAYRDLQYTYGAYALSPRLARPTRLQFWVDDAPGGGTHVRLQVDTHVRRWFAAPWRLGNRVFWGRFERWLDRAVARRARPAAR